MFELPPLPATPPEVSLLLRVHAEQSWLHREVLPVVRQVQAWEGLPTGRVREREDLPARHGHERGDLPESLPEEQVPAAKAYLEVVWAEAVRRAGETDGACTCLELALPAPDRGLGMKARRYRAAVVAVREEAAQSVGELLGGTGEETVAETGTGEEKAAGAEWVASRSCNR
jgi:hypothetical protein